MSYMIDAMKMVSTLNQQLGDVSMAIGQSSDEEVGSSLRCCVE